MYCNVDIVKAREVGKEVVAEGSCELEMDFSINTLIHMQRQEEGKALLTQETEKITGTSSVQEKTAM